MNGESPPDSFAGAEGEDIAAPAIEGGAEEGQRLRPSVPRPEPRIPYARAHGSSSVPSQRKGTIPGVVSAPPTSSAEAAYQGPIPGPAPLPRLPDVNRIVAQAEQEAGGDPVDVAIAAPRRSRRVVKVTVETSPLSPMAPVVDGAPPAVAFPITTPAALSGPQPEVSDDDWLSPESAGAKPARLPTEPISTPEAPRLEGSAASESEAAPPSALAPPDVPSPLARSSVPRPAPRPVSVRRPSGSPEPALAELVPGTFIADPDSVAVIRPIQIISVSSDLPAVVSTDERAPVVSTDERAPVVSTDEREPSAPELYVVEDADDAPALPLRFVSDGPTPLDATAELLRDLKAELPREGLAPVSAPDDGPPTAREWGAETPGSTPSSPDFSGSAAAAWATPPQSEEAEGRSSVDEIEAEPLEEVEPEPRSGEMEPLEEVEPERDSDSGDEIPIDMVDELKAQPKKPPPPPPRRGRPPVPPLPDLPAYLSPVPPSGASAAEAPRAATSTSGEPPAAAQAPADPVAPASEAVRRKKSWWEELFGDDFIRTLDKLEPKRVRHEVDFIEERLGVEKGAVILDLACGVGAHAVEMASRGYSIVGYDLSLAMLSRAADEAQERQQKLNFLQGDMREMAFEGTFDAVYCWSTSFGYFEEDRNADVLQRVRRALRVGGMLLLDVINRDYVACRQPSLVWFEGEGCVCMDEMQVDFFSSRLKVKRTVMFEDGRSRELDYSIRLYNLHELGKLLHEAGFKVTEVTGHPAHPGVFFGSESPRILILAERS